MSKIRKMLVGLTILVLGFGLGFYLRKPLPDKQVVPQASDNRLDTLITLDTPKGPLGIGVFKDQVYFRPYESADNPYAFFSISKDKYPELFKQGVANSSIISARVVNDTKSGKVLVVLSNSQPDHGGYSPVYQLTVDPMDGKVVSQ